MATKNSTKGSWSTLYGDEIDVKPIDSYEVVTHMKLNKWAMQSHAKLEGYNESSKEWYQIKQCPSGTNGPIEWREFNCVITIPQGTTKIRPVLTAGWSSQDNQWATTWFDSIYIIKLNPFITDPNLKADIVYQGLDVPNFMTFMGPDDYLVSEKDKGTIQRITNGTKSKEPLLDLAVARHDGLLGIAAQKNLSTSRQQYVYLFVTEAERDGQDLVGKKPIGNRIYRYEYVNNTLLYPKLLLDLPAGSEHNGGKILIGPDNYLYLTVGEVFTKNRVKNSALNYEGNNGTEPDGRAGILRVNLDGNSPTVSILGDKEPLNKYYAYGIRNSFGIDFDPLSGNLWDTENGPNFGDEINLVKPGFNSGWEKVQGFWTVPAREKVSEQVDNLTNFNGKGKYSSPEFTWNHTVGPTALKFLSTDKLGKQYENDMFVADVNNGRIYHFQLNQNRTSLLLKGPLNDKVADSDEELSNVIFAQGFGMITDLEVGPDGYLYILSHDQGKIYKIVPGHMNQGIVDYVGQIFEENVPLVKDILSNSIDQNRSSRSIDAT